MKVFVATGATQGARTTDFTSCIEGELVWMLDACPISRRNPDGICGCGRSFSGLNSHGSTTTAQVRNIRRLTRGDYEAALLASFEAQGWCSCCSIRPVAEIIDELILLARPWQEGAVVERSLDDIHLRVLVGSGSDGAG